MRIPWLFLCVCILLVLVVDFYVYRRCRACRSKWPVRIQILSAVALYGLLIAGLAIPARSGGEEGLLDKMWVLFAFFTFFVGKCVFVIFDALLRIPAIFHRRPLRCTPWIAGGVGTVVFAAMWWGALVNRFSIRLEHVELELPGLPESFSGYRIVQISDLHVGTYGDDEAYLRRLVAFVDSLRPDVIFFTGDLVNRTTSELEPFVETLSRLQAADGVVSILGNHDYGDYYTWPDQTLKAQSFRRLVELQRRMGWTLLLNDHLFINRGADSVAVVGVENVGDPPFSVYGNLQNAYPDLSDTVFKILLTHNPAHWKAEIADNPGANIGLTLSGHTHAMQIEVFGLSPAAWRYPTWGGLYRDSGGNHPLYVNIGIGTVGMPMRLGATPEVTLFTLYPKR